MVLRPASELVFTLIAQARFRRLEVILIPEDYVLLGRDVLNHFYTHLNGPDLDFDLRLSP